MQLGEEAAAIDDFSQALLLRPRDVAALLGRGDAYFKLAKYAEALTDFDSAVRLAPRNRDALYRRAQVRFQQQDYDAAIQDLNLVISAFAALRRRVRQTRIQLCAHRRL